MENQSLIADSEHFIEDEQWELLEAKVIGRDDFEIVVEVKLQRRPLHYSMAFVAPTVVLYILSGLTFLLVSRIRIKNIGKLIKNNSSV